MKPAFRIIRAALPLDLVLVIASTFRRLHAEHSELRAKGQTGIKVTSAPDMIQEWLQGIRPGMRLLPSSCRLQTPDGAGALELHQDAGVIGGGTNPNPMQVIWLPLTPIDDATPSLEICPIIPPRHYWHQPDAAGYHITREADAAKMPLVAITKMNLGDIIVMSPYALHRSYVRPWHTKERLSLDLRFLPSWADRRDRIVGRWMHTYHRGRRLCAMALSCVPASKKRT